MLLLLKEIYFTAFTLGFRISGSSWSPVMNASKGVGGVSIFEAFILMSIGSWIEMYLGERVLLSVGKWVVGAAFLFLYCMNYYFLVIRGYGINFERKFSKLENARRRILLVSCAMLLFAIIALMLASVSVYHRHFHIIPKGGF